MSSSAPCRFTSVRSGEGSWPCCAAAPRPLVANLLRRCGVHREWLYLQSACSFGLLLQWVAATADASLDPLLRDRERSSAHRVQPTPQAEPAVRRPNMRVCPLWWQAWARNIPVQGTSSSATSCERWQAQWQRISVGDASGTAARCRCRAWQRPFGSTQSVRFAMVQESVGRAD